MYGSGMIVINPPWTLRGEMEEALPFLAQALGAGPAAQAEIEQWIDE
jgi:23S rRNA (adenine2030-N6)-methyltransferase